MSYAQLSKFNVERLIITDPDHKMALNKTVLNAREIAQRTINSYVDENKKLMDNLWENTFALEGGINDSLYVFDIVLVGANIGREFIENAEDLIIEDIQQLVTFEMNIKHNFPMDIIPYAKLYKRMNTFLNRNIDQTYSFIEIMEKCIHAESVVTTESSTGNNSSMWYETSTPQPSKSPTITTDRCRELLSYIHNNVYSFGVISNDIHYAQNNYNSLNDYYQDYVEIYYKNTNQNASGIKEHLECTDVLQNVDKHIDIVDELLDVALNLSKETSYENIWKLLVKADNINEHLYLPEAIDHYSVLNYLNESYTLPNVDNNKPLCKWLLNTVKSKEYKNKIESARESLELSIVVASGMRSKHNLMEAAIPELVTQFEILKQFQMKAMNAYMLGDISKMDMDLSFHATAGQASIKEMTNLELTIQSAAMSLKLSAKQICDYFEDTYLTLFDLSIPILNTNNIVDLHMIKVLNHTAPIGLVEPTTGQFVANVDSIFSRILKGSFQEYMSAIELVSEALVPKIKTVVYAIDMIEINLQQYIKNSRIDEQFFM